MTKIRPGSIRSADAWIRSHGWKPFPFQREAWKAYLGGHDLLIHSATGTGKTLAACLGPILQSLQSASSLSARSGTTPETVGIARVPSILWITPLRALAGDTQQSLEFAISGLSSPWRVETRTGDTSSRIKKNQRAKLPDALVTTPESLTILLSYADTMAQLSHLRAVVVDEWHELLGSKRGVLLELALARLRKGAPHLQTIGLSATLGNLDEAFDVLVGPSSQRPRRIVHGKNKKRMTIRSVLPHTIERFPWAGHLGTRLVEDVCQAMEQAKTSLIFTNTRNQTELWYQELLKAHPEYAGQLALHHGSLDSEVRDWVERALRDARLRGVVCTSSLDLGVDFASVEQVVQIGSPKGIARLLQRAGRSGHQPNAESRLLFVPTNTLELLEIAAARRMMKRGILEGREPERLPLDLLAQHLVTMGLESSYQRTEMYDEVRSTHAFAGLTGEEFEWTVRFAKQGGDSLSRYEEFRRLEEDEAGNLMVRDPKTIRRHRMSIGTIVAEVAVQVRYMNGKNLGNVEEIFASKLKPGDRFLFAGKLLELVRMHDSVAWVRKGKGTPTAVPRWVGGRMPLSSQLSEGIRELIEEAALGGFHEREIEAIRPVLELQREWSHLPKQSELLLEMIKTRDGFHLCIYPFDGRLVHEGLAAILAYRLSRQQSITFSLAANDYGFMLHSTKDPQVTLELVSRCLHAENLESDITAGLNATEMAKRQFREIARIAGLIRSSFPGERRSGKHLQVSSDLIYEVFTNYDPNNLLLLQAKQEVLRKQLQWDRLQHSLRRISNASFVWRDLQRPTPFAFALIVDRLRERLSSESLADRIRRMQQQLELAASKRKQLGTIGR
jgi:ATP-dependent Lhr-like helicase